MKIAPQVMNISNKMILVPENHQFPELGFLADEAMLAEYHNRIQKYSENARNVLNIFQYDAAEKVIQGSNPFGCVELASKDLALPSELEHAVRLSPAAFKGIYVDLALLLRAAGDSYSPNDYLAKHLAEQIKHRTGKVPTPELPARISLKGLTLEEDNTSHYGLVFKLGEQTETLLVPEYSHENNGKRFSKTNERGVPIFNDGGNRYFWTRQGGLSRLCLGRGSSLYSNDDYLAGSDAVGRVPVVKGAAGAEKF